MPAKTTMTRDGRKALQQALACAGVVALMVAAVQMVARQPGNDELRLAIAELRSQAAELELLRARSAAGAVTPRFAREHAQQLARAIDASREKLASTKVDPPLASARAAATALPRRWPRPQVDPTRPCPPRR